MDIRERLRQIEQAHAQHVQLLQQTQANIIRLEGAQEILREQVAAADEAGAALLNPPANVLSFKKRVRRTKAQLEAAKAPANPEPPADSPA